MIFEEKNTFLKRVVNYNTISSYNFSLKDFQTTKYKPYIRELFERNLGKIDYSKDILNTNIIFLNNQIEKMISKNKSEFINLFNLSPQKSIGSGEILLYYLIDDFVLSGGNKPYDAESSNKEIEIKSTNLKLTTNEIFGFRIAISKETSETLNIITDLIELAKSNNIITKTSIDISSNKIMQLRKNSNTKIKYEFIRKKYSEVISNYLNKRLFIAFNKNNGKILFLDKKIFPELINIYEVTQGNIKPSIKV
jgi:hypothetical protein